MVALTIDDSRARVKPVEAVTIAADRFDIVFAKAIRFSSQ
jgi:hypothetical protein